VVLVPTQKVPGPRVEMLHSIEEASVLRVKVPDATQGGGGGAETRRDPA